MKNYFKTFDIEEKFETDLDNLEAKYLEFQCNFHPDKAGIEEVEKSILVNEAFDVLQDDFLRACHLLKINGVDVEDDSKAPKVDFETLSEIMEIQEKITEIGDEEKVKLLKEVEVKKDSLFKQVIVELNDKNFAKAAQNLMKFKYFRKIFKDLKK